MVAVVPKLICCLYYSTFNLSFWGIFFPHYSEIIMPLQMKQIQFSGRRNRDGPEAMEDEEQALHSAFRLMGKNIDNIITRAIKTYVVLFGNGSLLDLALTLES